MASARATAGSTRVEPPHVLLHQLHACCCLDVKTCSTCGEGWSAGGRGQQGKGERKLVPIENGGGEAGASCLPPDHRVPTQRATATMLYIAHSACYSPSTG
jgi:hypothetical protein